MTTTSPHPPSATTPQVRFRRDESVVTDEPRWIVLVDGKAVGKVEQRSVRQDHKPRGARYITRSTYSNRWIAAGESRLYRVSRRHAVADLLEKALGVDRNEATSLAGAGRNETKTERAAR